ncbi:hypothetical protein HD600_001884 [Microbacterium ginsengiterrae]|uniref:DUF222 domain-containing protein n=1 Tax=Microbacterium ginsengiterrae TaxID=546115 RepID=A0A7W9CDN3_9MICO|nr:HNH endonuclease signature motif containing protein [Microbacterium ginsengiterrae]MBB5743387.1 hypothetical protein [Microbacterium ginsengiterrae]
MGDVEIDALLTVMRGLDDEAIVDAMADAAKIAHCAERMLTVGAGVVAERSRREDGHSGLAASRGQRNAVALVQSIVGGTRADAARAVRLGESLSEGADAAAGGAFVGGGGGDRVGGQPGDAVGGGLAGDAGDSGDAGGLFGAGAGSGGSGRAADVRMPWHEPLRRALFEGRVTTAQHDAIFRGLGQPPVRGEDEVPSESTTEVWSLAAAQLVGEAGEMSVEDLVRRARQVRDTLDPEGVQERFEQSYAQRSWRSWRNADGAHHTHIVSDDETAAWLDSIRDAALRPRRGGPRFMTEDERAAASALVDDARTNDQIAYDLFMDILRAGALASASDVFGARQPGIRIVTIDGATGAHDAFGRMLATAHLEDGGDALPGTVVDRNLCTVGSRSVRVDGNGNPLDVGREQRLYTSRQRVALAVRDGGCMFPECRVPASYCEAHHCDHWLDDDGRTDLDRGILLCRHHHMLLHNNGWKITRDDLGPFMLHPPGRRGSGEGGGGQSHGATEPATSEPIALTSRSPLRWAWDPPPEWPHWRSMPATAPTRARDRAGELQPA